MLTFIQPSGSSISAIKLTPIKIYETMEGGKKRVQD